MNILKISQEIETPLGPARFISHKDGIVTAEIGFEDVVSFPADECFVIVKER